MLSMSDLLKDWIIPLVTIGTVVVTAYATILKNTAAIDKIKAVFEEKFKNMEEKIDAIMKNHLPHISNKVDRIGERCDETEKRMSEHITEYETLKKVSSNQK